MDQPIESRCRMLSACRKKNKLNCVDLDSKIDWLLCEDDISNSSEDPSPAEGNEYISASFALVHHRLYLWPLSLSNPQHII